MTLYKPILMGSFYYRRSHHYSKNFAVKILLYTNNLNKTIINLYGT